MSDGNRDRVGRIIETLRAEGVPDDEMTGPPAPADGNHEGTREVGGIDRFGNWHNLDDLSADTGGKWWWLCSCGQARGGYDREHAAHRGWGEHLAVALAEVGHG